MRRVVMDTGIYSDFLNAGRHEEVLFERQVVKYMSAVVLMELRAGAFSARDQKLLKRLERSFDRAGRMLVPTAKVFVDAGDVLRRLQRDHRYNLKNSPSITNDVIIALSARSIGAAVVTQNAKDFVAIRTLRSFRLRILRDS